MYDCFQQRYGVGDIGAWYMVQYTANKVSQPWPNIHAAPMHRNKAREKSGE